MKNDTPLEDFLEQCKVISNTWSKSTAFNLVPISKNPLKDAEVKGHRMNSEDRVHWKSKGLYYAILSDTAKAFQESYKAVFTEIEFNELCKIVKESTKEVALSFIKNTLGKLKKRKYRLTSSTESHTIHTHHSP